jgi:hypothetical protein
MMLELQPYYLTVKYSKVPIGDALSRATLKDDKPDMKPIDVNMIKYISVSESRYEEFQKQTAQELNSLQQIIQKGWPDNKWSTPHAIRDFWTLRDELTLTDGIILYDILVGGKPDEHDAMLDSVVEKAAKNNLKFNFVVLPSLRGEMLKQLHETHQGINKSKRRAREIMYWPGMGKHIEDMIKDCPPCSENQKKLSDEPMIRSQTPDLPWTKLAADIFHWEGADYLVLIDYFSKYIEADKLANLTSQQLIEVFKAQISRHGIPEKLRADNGTQHTSAEFEGFLNEYG